VTNAFNPVKSAKGRSEEFFSWEPTNEIPFNGGRFTITRPKSKPWQGTAD